MRNIALSFFVTFLVTGCSLFGGPGSQIGWNDSIPPVTDGVGRLVENGSLASQAFSVTPDMLEELNSYQQANFEEQSKYTAAINMIFSKATANVGLEYEGSKSGQSTKWKIVQLKDFKKIVYDKKFAYRCLTTEKFTYTVNRKTKAGVTLDATKLAESVGAESAKIDVSMSPTKPDKADITVEDPRVCLSFVSAEFVRDRWFWESTDTPRSFTLDNKKSFFLKSNTGTLAGAEPDFGKRALQSKPIYKLYAAEEKGRQVLKVKILDRQTFETFDDVVITETLPGVWQTPTKLPPFQISNDVYGNMRIEISAILMPDNNIKINWAHLYSPEYKLKVR